MAKVEMFQIVVFDWNEEKEILELVSFGSGTAVSSGAILTSKHVVQAEDGSFADFILLCQAQANAGESAVCNIPAGVSAAHDIEDVALIRPIENKFFPKVKVSYQKKRVEDPIRVLGFPTPEAGKLGFGDTKTVSIFETWLNDTTQPLSVEGDKLTVTRGQVQARLKNKDTGFTYTKTDAKVNFGNSGGAAFDEYGEYLGIVTFKDKVGNSIFLEYHQIDQWVRAYQSKAATFDQAAYDFYKKTQTPTKKKVSEELTLQQRIEALRSRQMRTKSTSRQGRVLTPKQIRLYEYLRQKRLRKD